MMKKKVKEEEEDIDYQDQTKWRKEWEKGDSKQQWKLPVEQERYQEKPSEETQDEHEY